MIGNNDLLEDLVSDTFIKLIEKVSLIRGLNCHKLSAYVVAAGKRVAINHLRDREVQDKHIPFADDVEDAALAIDCGDIVEERVISQDEFRRLKAVIQHLPEKQRHALYYKCLFELEDKEIAQRLSLASNSVRQYLTRARRAARRLIEKEEMGTDGQPTEES